MSEVLVYERASPAFAATLAQRGHHIVYRTNSDNHCPGCGRSHWYIGRISAECGFCGTAIPLAEARRDEPVSPSQRRTAVSAAEQRRHLRIPAKDRKLQLLIDGSPTSFALQNISEGGAMGDNVADLAPGANSMSGSRAASSFQPWSNGPKTGWSASLSSRPSCWIAPTSRPTDRRRI